MKALFCYDGPLYRDERGNYYDSVLNDQMFQRYFKVASDLDVIIRVRDIDEKLAKEKMSRLLNPHIKVIECPNLSSLRGLLNGYFKTKKILNDRVKDAGIAFIRLPSVIGNLAVDICRKTNTKYLIEVVGCPWDSYWNYSLKGKIVAPIAMFSMKKRVAQAPYVLYVTKNFLQKRYPTKGKQINCSNVELIQTDASVLTKRLKRIEQKNSKNTFIIGTAAGLDVLYKGQQYVIKALGKLKKMGFVNFEYQLIGGGTGDYLMQIARECNVENQVKIIGQLPHDKVFTWLDDLDAYIQPSRQEGLPRSMIEAMSRGLPCYGARTAGIPELLDSNFLFSNSKTEIDEIVALLLETYNNKDTQMKQAERNYKEALKYQRNILVERRTKFFTDCMYAEN